MTPSALAQSWARSARLDSLAAMSANRAALAAAADARSAAAAGDGAGLVSNKTSGDDVPGVIPLSWSKEAQREARVKRLRRAVWATGRVLETECLSASFSCWLVTLTYDTRGTLGNGAHDWSPRHISNALKAFRHWCQKRGTKARYVWVAELQQKGTVHYHVAVWLPSHMTCPKWDQVAADRGAFWPYGMANRERARNAVGYLMKYMSKIGKHHEYPRSCRTYGQGGITPDGRQICAWVNYPRWLQALAGVGGVLRIDGARVLRQTGEVLASPYELVRAGCQLFLRTVRPVAEAWASGPYSDFPRVTV